MVIQLNPTPYAKRQRAIFAYVKGKNFLAAAILLDREGGYRYVFLHLLCQSLEVIAKSLFLLKDFDRYRLKLKGQYGHNLVSLIRDLHAEFGLAQPRAPLAQELQNLNSYYQANLFRYDTFLDVLVDPSTIPSGLTFRRLAAGVRMAERELARASGP